MTALEPLMWLEVRPGLYESRTFEGDVYRVVVGAFGFEWSYHGNGMAYGELCSDLADGQELCEEHRAENSTAIEHSLGERSVANRLQALFARR